MPSSVVVTDYQSLAQNFSENAKFVLCQAAFGAGAYAIGGRLVGAAALTPPAALVTAGALLTALTLCPNEADQQDIFGSPPQFSGGRCPVFYNFTATIVDRTGFRLNNQPGFFLGPATKIFAPFESPFGSSGGVKNGNTNTTGSFNGAFGSDGAPYRIENVVVTRQDGQPDNCGSNPNQGGQIIRNTNTGDTIDNSKVTNNSNFTTVIPVLFNAGGINTTINLNFGPIEIGSLFPLNFNIDIGGIGVNFRQKPDGTLEPDYSNPDPSLPDNKLQKLLKEIKDCVCQSPVELDNLLLSTVASDAPCDFRTETLQVLKDSVSGAQFARFVTTANLAKESCQRNSVAQLPEELIYSATTTQDGRELFTGLIEPDVVSLILRITAITSDGPDLIRLYPASNQRKFGSVSFVTDGVNGGGDYVYIFDEETFLPLPKRGKNGRLRILMKRGLSFSVYDSGERI